MGILWKPTGTLDVNTAATDLPEQSDGRNIISGAMTRCKNLRLDRNGIAQLRYGSSLLTSFTSISAPELILDAAGHRYIFAGDQIFYDEALVSEVVSCAAPVFLPAGGSYLSDQTVTITTATTTAVIFYTLDGETPTSDSPRYTVPVVVPGHNYLKAIAIDERGYLSDSAVTSAFYGLWAQNALVTESNENALITEGGNALTTEGP